MTSGEFRILCVCLIEACFLAWGWFCGGFRRVNIPPCSERLAYLERELDRQKQDLHDLRNRFGPVVTWVEHRRAQEKRVKPSA